MYSEEIEDFLRERNYVVTMDECNRLVDINVNTQIKNMKFFCANNEYVINTEDGYCFKFWVIPNQE